jgi:hypothetical protein
MGSSMLEASAESDRAPEPDDGGEDFVRVERALTSRAVHEDGRQLADPEPVVVEGYEDLAEGDESRSRLAALGHHQFGGAAALPGAWSGED